MADFSEICIVTAGRKTVTKTWLVAWNCNMSISFGEAGSFF